MFENSTRRFVGFLTHAFPRVQKNLVFCEQQQEDKEKHHNPNLGRRIVGLPSFSRKQVSEHADKNKSVWVTYKEGVYDVTDFVSKHPGGEKILLGAGKAVDPFWRLYAQHTHLPHISHLMEEMRIGNLDEADVVVGTQQGDDESTDPYRVDSSIERHPGLVFITERPANAEVPPSLLCDSFLTPNELFFVRHHFPVPDPSEAGSDRVKIGDIHLSLEDIETRFEQQEVIATIQCTGNRRTGFNAVEGKSVKGLTWSVGAISTARWKGAKLSDVIKLAFPKGIPTHVKHVCFTGRDSDGNGQHYGISLRLDHAMKGDVILATRMNGEAIPLDHGAPIRVVVPGAAGCRSVKWLKEIELSDKESPAFWQKQDYKSFSPSQGWEGLDFDSAPAVMTTPVQSAICECLLSDDKKSAVVKGYSFSGGGNAIIRVDVSADGGETWTDAELQNEFESDGITQLPYKNTFSWTLWTAVVDIDHSSSSDKKNNGEVEIVVKAVDESYNSQPERPEGIWNVRGILNNSWHRVKVKVS